MSNNNSVDDIRGKDLKYEEQTKTKSLTTRLKGTIACFVGAANWGPIGTQEAIVKDNSIFGGEVNKDDQPKDFSKLASDFYLDHSPLLYFTRVTDGSDQKASKSISRVAVAAKIKGGEKIAGKLVNISDDTQILKIQVDGVEQDIAIQKTSGVGDVESGEISTTDIVVGDVSALSNLEEGTLFDIEIDGEKFLYVVEAGDLFTKLKDIDGSDFIDGTIETGENSHSYVDIDLTNYITAGVSESLTVDGNVITIAADATKDTIFNSIEIAGYTKKLIDVNTIRVYKNDISSPAVSDVTGIVNTLITTTDFDGSTIQTVNSFFDRLYVAIKTLVFEETAVGGYVSKNSNKIVFTSEKVGSESSIKIKSAPIVFPNITSESPIIETSVNDSIDSVVSEIDELLNNATIFINVNNVIEIQTTQKGSAASLRIVDNSAGSTNHIISLLGLKDNINVIPTFDLTETDFLGEGTASEICTFIAKYTGSDGNNIKILKTTENGFATLYIEFNNNSVARFSNYSLDSSSANFLGTLINNSPSVSKIIELVLPNAVTIMSQIPDGIYYLTGGTSGITNIDDVQYAQALDAYRDTNIYSTIDLIAVPGNSSITVINKLEEVCEYRKDCFCVIDPPETVGGMPGAGTGGKDAMINWHKGLLDNSMMLDSKYISTYFPWVLIETASDINPKQWLPPSIPVMGAIAEFDAARSNKFGGAAGIDTRMDIIEAVAHPLINEDRVDMGDDALNNMINVITYTKAHGFHIDMQKTTLRDGSAYNRQNVMRVGLFIKRKVYELAPAYFNLPVGKNSRDEFKAAIEKRVMSILQEATAIQEGWQVICDVSNNPLTVEKSKGMILRIEWEDVDTLEKIKVQSVLNDTKVVSIAFE